MRESAERLHNLYLIIANEALPDSEIDTRVNIIRHLETETAQEFLNTEDFHKKMSAFFLIQGGPGGQLREAREAKGWNQEALAAYLNVSQQYVGMMERGKKPLTPRASLLVDRHFNEK